MSKTHVIDGVTYVEVDRKAEVGDKIISLIDDPLQNKDFYVGSLHTVTAVEESDDDGDYCVGISESRGFYSTAKYRVLAEVKECCVDTTQASPAVIDMLANLARRVTSLERQLADTQRNVERQAEELAKANYGISLLTCDVLALDDRTQVIKAIAKFYEEGSR
jgi:hypothetical protein